jgi:hypothetical protein
MISYVIAAICELLHTPRIIFPPTLLALADEVIE